MNGDEHGNHEQEAAAEYLRKIARIYDIKLVGGIKAEEPAGTKSDVQKSTSVHVDNIPVDVEVRPDWPMRGVAVFALLVSIGTLGLLVMTVIFTRLQWQEANRTADASEQSAAATKRASDTAAQTLNESIKESNLDQRAWVGLSYADSIISVQKNGEITFGALKISIPTVRNTGTTPAKRASAIFEFWKMDGRVDATDIDAAVSDPKWMKRVLDREDSGLLGPHQIRNMSDPDVVKDQDHRQIHDTTLFPRQAHEGAILDPPEKRALGVLSPDIPYTLDIGGYTMLGGDAEKAFGAFVIFGRIKYWDIWEKPHTTTFCTYTSDANRMAFRACPAFNDMD